MHEFVSILFYEGQKFYVIKQKFCGLGYVYYYFIIIAATSVSTLYQGRQNENKNK